jgi:4-hydroxybenzoate polyprenyltransferase
MWPRPAHLVAIHDGRRHHGRTRTNTNLVQAPYDALMAISSWRSAVDFLIRNRFHLGPGAVLIIWALPPWYGSTPAWNAAPSILLAGFGLYQLNRVFDLVEDQVNDPSAYARTAAARNALRRVAIGALLASVGLSVILMNKVATALLAIMLLPGVLYSVPCLKRGPGGLHRLKQVLSLKNVIPSVVWPVTTILYPAISRPGVHWLPLTLAISAVACSVFTIEVAWDVRDSRGDRVAGVRTLATEFGPARALRVPFLVSCAQALVIALLVYSGELAARWLFLAMLLVLLPAVAYLWKNSLASNRNRSHLLVLMNISALIPLGLVGR